MPALPDPYAIVLSLAFATLLSEDLACIAAGLLVADGQIGLVPAIATCFVGIAAGDLLLFAAGRIGGRRLLRWRLVRMRLSAEALDRSAVWLERHEPYVVLLTRFVPGTRLPTYVAAGMLGRNTARFAFWFLIAGALWTPALVGGAAVLGMEVASATLATGRVLVACGLVTALMVGGVGSGVRRLGTWGGRRRLVGAWRRLTRWEFWPAWILYLPVAFTVLVEGLKYRRLTAFTAANPGIPASGFIGESKFEILQNLAKDRTFVARAARLPASVGAEGRLWLARQFLAHAGLTLPVVLKPDQGQRGTGVAIARTAEEMRAGVEAAHGDLIVQEYVEGHEFGVFYYRHPSEPRGRIFSITEKRFPCVVGDGVKTVEELILADDRAVCQERVHRRALSRQLGRVPAGGEVVRIVEIGSHCRGSLFLDASAMRTPAMEEAFDRLARRFEGFYFGRFDVRTPSVDDFRAGRNFKVLELNGVTSEATHIYDPATRLTSAWRVLCRQWSIACGIGVENIARGARPTSLVGLLRMTWRYRRARDADAARPGKGPGPQEVKA